MTKSFIAEVHSKEFLSERHFILRLVPYIQTRRPEPGQFYLIRTGTGYDPFLRRPFSVFNWSEDLIEFFIMQKGRGTEQLMRTSKGAVLEVLGPLGSGFKLPEERQRPYLCGGGLGIAPLYYLARSIKGPKTIVYGGKTSDDLVLKKHLKMMEDVKLVLATEDGTEGVKGTVLDVLKTEIEEPSSSVVYACGPGPMMKAIKEDVFFAEVETYLSVEERMACGVGVCLGCAYPTKEGMKRVCLEGPVFKLEEI
ncbi:MAG: dihydroorotate dehydrogenase electron transfer subunit [Nitrospirae bacterium]|nr:MAG: dihydroorotate dehydrogenase electron transfer subunit [Nitrospirota bacterium]